MRNTECGMQNSRTGRTTASLSVFHSAFCILHSALRRLPPPRMVVRMGAVLLDCLVGIDRKMGLPPQTIALLAAARQLVHTLPADAILLLTESDLNWESVLQHLDGCRLLVAAEDGALTERLKAHPLLTVLDIDPGPTPTQERMSLALLEAVRSDKLRQGADVVAVYNGIDTGED